MCKVRPLLPGVWLSGKVHTCVYRAACVSFPANKNEHSIDIYGRKLTEDLCIVHIFIRGFKTSDLKPFIKLCSIFAQ